MEVYSLLLSHSTRAKLYIHIYIHNACLQAELISASFMQIARKTAKLFTYLEQSITIFIVISFM